MRLPAIAFCLAGIPSLTLAVLAMLGRADAWPTLTGVVAGLAAAAVFIVLWRQDLERLTEAVRRMAPDEAAPVRAADSIILMDSLALEIERVSRRRAAFAGMLAQYRRTDSLILERLPDPVIVLAPDRSVRRANAAARAAFGEDLAAVLRHPGLRGAIERALASNATEAAEISLRVPMLRDVHVTVVPMSPSLADGGQTLVVLSDRTRERAVERMRADFVANVSHELRTPLASLIGFVETLRGPAAEDPPAQRRFLAIMADQGARMNRLIDDLLSLSRIELTEHQIPAEPLDLAALVSRSVASFEPRLAERNVQLALRIEPNLPTVAGDADQLAQVLENLLDNAVKYGRDGGVLSVSVSMPSRETPQGLPQGDRWPARRGIVVAVADQGAGIPREHLPRLTERFYRVDKGRSRAVGGTGLGLAIVKHIVNRHRGQLIIDSEVGQGTTVSVWLPASQVSSRLANAV